MEEVGLAGADAATEVAEVVEVIESPAVVLGFNLQM